MQPRITTTRPRVAGVVAGSLIAAFAATALAAVPAAADDTVETPDVAAGAALTWGLKASFLSYLQGPIAHGSVTATAPASFDGTLMSFPVADDQREDASYEGSVHFSGHDGILDVTIAEPEVVIDGDAAVLVATVTPSGGEAAEVELADLDLSGVTPVEADGLLTYTGVPSVLTEEGAPAFAYNGSPFYEAGTALDPVTFSVPVIDPTVTVSATDNIDGLGTTLTVTGSGFLPDGTATNGTRPPLAGQFGGAYVVVGKFPEVWQPSAGVASSARSIAVQQWAVPAASAEMLGDGTVVLEEDGTFEVTLDVNDQMLLDKSGNWGVYTYPGSGAKYADFETYTPITFAPRVEVSETEGLADDAQVTVNGFNFINVGAATTGTRPPLSGQFTGAYVASGKFADVWKSSEGAGRDARTTSDVRWGVHEASLPTIGGAGAGGIVIAPNGTFSTTLELDKYSLVETDGNWGIYTYPGGGAAYAPFETFTPVTFASDDTGVTDVVGTKGETGYTPFADHINWLFNTGITTGWSNGDGTSQFRPFANVNRDQMAAFLYRAAGVEGYEAPAEPTFTDVPTTHVFYTQIEWLAETGITTGWENKDGSLRFQPTTAVNRDMMAAFLYRFAALGGFPGAAEYEAGATSPFLDVPTDHVFYTEISWLAEQGVTTGWAVEGGANFRPTSAVKRDVMAAFLYRFLSMEAPV